MSWGIHRHLSLENGIKEHFEVEQMLVDYLILSDRTPAQMFAPEVVVR